MKTKLLQDILFSWLFLSVSGVLRSPAWGADTTARPDAATPLAKVLAVIPVTSAPIALTSIIAQVSINGQPPLPFMVDTGSSIPVIIQSWAAKLLGLSLGKDKMSVNEGTITITSTSLQSFSVVTKEGTAYNLGQNSVYIGDIPFLHLYGKPPIAGVLGFSAFGDARVRFDLAAGTMTLLSSTGHLERTAKALALPLAVEDSLPYASFSLTEKTPNHYLIDTGFNGFDITPLEATHVPRVAFSFNPMGTASQTSISDFAPAVSIPIKMGGTRPTAVLVLANVPEESSSIRMGLGFLSLFRFTLDATDKLFILEPQPHPESRASGFTSIGVDDKNCIIRVWPWSAAYHAGLRIGDELLQVDGQDSLNVGSAFLSDALAGTGGTIAKLRVRKTNNKIVLLSFVRESDLNPTAYLRPGFRVNQWRINGKFGFYVKALLLDAPAARAGVVPVDQILSINGILTAGKTLPEVEALLQKPSASLVLSLQHQGETTSQTVTISFLPSAPVPTPSASSPPPKKVLPKQ